MEQKNKEMATETDSNNIEFTDTLLEDFGSSDSGQYMPEDFKDPSYSNELFPEDADREPHEETVQEQPHEEAIGKAEKDNPGLQEFLAYLENKEYSYEEAEFQDEFLEEDLDSSMSLSILERAEASEFLPRIDIAYLYYLEKHYPLADKKDQQLFNAVLLALFAKMHNGDICINLQSLDSICAVYVEWNGLLQSNLESQQDRSFAQDLFALLPAQVEDLYALLQRAPAVGSPDIVLPLVFDHQRLYVRRYFVYEKSISSFIHQVNQEPHLLQQDDKLRSALTLLFTDDPSIHDLNWQKVAAAMSTISRFTVISGGPGTGKTTTVLRILLLLISSSTQSLSIKLCAPTGKAAARMGESISKQLKNPHMLDLVQELSELFGKNSDEIRASIPEKAETVHRLLNVRPHVSKPLYNAQNHLPCDILVVDEVSMLDLALCSKLLDSLDQSCHIIMLGDKDQLSSVEAGAVLGDLCYSLKSSQQQRIQQQTLDYLSFMTGYSPAELLRGQIADNTVLLRFSYRSRDVPEIGQLAQLVNAAGGEDTPVPQDDFLDGDISLDEYARIRHIVPFQSEVEQLNLNNTFLFTDSHESSPHDSLQQILDLFDKSQKHKKNISFLSLTPRGGDGSVLIQDLIYERTKLAKRCVAPGRKDNYAPFLERLRHLHFTVDRNNIQQCDELFRLMDGYRILCSNHSGLLGDLHFNKTIEREVRRTYLHDSSLHKEGSFFPGQIIIITKNDPVLGLVNGDVGFCAYDGSRRQQAGAADTELLRVFIPSGVEEVNGVHRTKVTVISPILLTNYDLGYAMSIHKSQGSEYDKITMVLTEQPNQVLTRELVYTAITRARKKVDVVAVLASLKYALSHSVERESGLALRLAEDRDSLQ